MGNPSFTAPGHPPRVLHFVTGGFSGATQVAIDLVDAHLKSGNFEPLLVLRRKRTTTPDRLGRLMAKSIPFQVVPGWSHAATVWSLVRICRQFKPDILVAHGFSDHIWARYAGLLAGVPHLVHVEHSPRERYTRWRLAQTKWLTQRTDRIICASEGIAERLQTLGLPSAKICAIPNGIQLHPYEDAVNHPYAERQPAIVMTARFARQKDHLTVIRACALLRDQGITPQIYFAGSGTHIHLRRAQQLVASLRLQNQIHFLGHHQDMPELLMQNQICLLSTHYEATTLALIEGMAAGCLAIGSDVTGVRELISNGENGVLFEENNAADLARVLATSLEKTRDMEDIAARGRMYARNHHSQALTNQRYEETLLSLLNP